MIGFLYSEASTAGLQFIFHSAFHQSDPEVDENTLVVITTEVASNWSRKSKISKISISTRPSGIGRPLMCVLGLEERGQ